MPSSIQSLLQQILDELSNTNKEIDSVILDNLQDTLDGLQQFIDQSDHLESIVDRLEDALDQFDSLQAIQDRLDDIEGRLDTL